MKRIGFNHFKWTKTSKNDWEWFKNDWKWSKIQFTNEYI